MILTHKVGQTDLVLVCGPGALVGLCMSVCSITICVTLVNTQTDSHTHTETAFDLFILIVQPAELKTLLTPKVTEIQLAVVVN